MDGYSEKKKMASAAAVFRVYWTHTRRYGWFLAAVLLFGAILQAANLAAPLYLRAFFNELSGSTPSTEAAQALIAILLLVFLMWFIDLVSRRLQDFSVMYLEARVMTELFDSTFSYLIKHSYNFFISNFAGSLTHKVTKFSRAYETLFDSILVQFFPTLLFIVGAVVVLFTQNRVLGIALGVWCVAFITFQVVVSRKRQPLRTARSEADTRVTGALADAISNHATINLFAGERHEEGLFGAVVDTWRAATLRSWFADAWIWAGIGVFMFAIESGLLLGAVYFWQQGLLTLGDFVLIQAYLLTVFDRLVVINRELRRFFDGYADASEMVYILEQPHGIADAPDASELEVSEGRIAFRDVTFAFGRNEPVFKSFSVEVQPREKVALVGPSGAGKSTVTRLLLRLYDVQLGSVEIDGQDIRSVTQNSLRENIAFVPQEPVLFHRTLMENIRYGRRGASDEEVMEAARQAHCHEFISALPDGYGTYVGERGVKLSGGERQRVAIARAILKDAPILLLDEATSSLDSESESLIQDALKVLMQGKTVVVIAHRLSTIMKMDRILVMQGGSIISEGSHADLVKGGGLYQKLWNIQAGGFVGDSGESVDLEEDGGDEEKEPPPLPMK